MTGRTIAQAAAELIGRHDLAELSEVELADAISLFLPLRTEQIRLAGQVIRWYKPIDSEPLLEEAVAGSQLPATDIDPFWSADWRAAYGLDHYLSRFDLHQQRILELGAGSGRAGIAAAMRGAQVTITDTVDIALLVARLNGWLVRDHIRLERLRWGDQQLAASPFPIILSSDLVYDPNHFPQLEHCAREHLAPGGRWYLSEPQRHSGDRFGTWIREHGWKCHEELIDMQDQHRPMRIFCCTREA